MLGRQGRGLLWLQDRDGHHAVGAYLRTGAQVTPFVVGAMSRCAPSKPLELPLADPAELAAMTVSQARAHLVGVHVLASYLGYDREVTPTGESLDDVLRGYVADGAQAASTRLGEADPVTVLLCGFQAYLDLWQPIRDGRVDKPAIGASADRAVRVMETVRAAFEAGTVDPGTVTYLLEILSLAVDRAEDACLGRRPDLERALDRSWRCCLVARGLDPDRAASAPAELSAAQVFHLLHFYAYLGMHGRLTDVRKALAGLERVVEVRNAVARDEPAEFLSKHLASRTAHEVTARVAMRLWRLIPVRERRRRQEALLTAVRHAGAALSSPAMVGELDAGRLRGLRVCAQDTLPPLAAALNANPPVEFEPQVMDLARRLAAAVPDLDPALTDPFTSLEKPATPEAAERCG